MIITVATNFETDFLEILSGKGGVLRSRGVSLMQAWGNRISEFGEFQNFWSWGGRDWPFVET
jgi:hypothetical protein